MALLAIHKGRPDDWRLWLLPLFMTWQGERERETERRHRHTCTLFPDLFRGVNNKDNEIVSVHRYKCRRMPCTRGQWMSMPPVVLGSRVISPAETKRWGGGSPSDESGRAGVSEPVRAQCRR